MYILLVFDDAVVYIPFTIHICTHTHYTHELKRLSHWENVTSKATTTVLHNSPLLPFLPYLPVLLSGIEELSKNKGNCQSIGFNNFLFLQMSESAIWSIGKCHREEECVYLPTLNSCLSSSSSFVRPLDHGGDIHASKTFTILQIIVKGFNCIPKDLM